MTTPIRPRDDVGSWHHVSNRALARRPLFENASDHELFLRKLREVIGQSRIELHAFCLVTNHFHLLVRSLDGQLSATMRDVQSQYSKWFNLRRDRDGPLVKSRFFSRPVCGLDDRFSVVRYIDQNPVKAGLAATPRDYDHGSAALFANGRPPRWLSSSCVEEILETYGKRPGSPFSGYSKAFGAPLSDGDAWLVEQRLRRGADTPDLQRLESVSHQEVLRWLQDAARLADGCDIGYLLACPRDIIDAIALFRSNEQELAGPSDVAQESYWRTLTAGLLRVACKLRYVEITELIGASPTAITRHLRDHRIRILSEPRYAEHVSRILHAELRAVSPGRHLTAHA